MIGPFRIDPPVIPAHVTCLREEVSGRTWVRRSDTWRIWKGAVTGSAHLAAEIVAYAPLAEHPDPRNSPMARINSNPEERT